MLISKKGLLSVGLLLLSSATYAGVGAARNLEVTPHTYLLESMDYNKTYLDVSLLFLQPNSDNLKYATFVSGVQPYYQSWHYQAITPDYHAAFELIFNYAFNHSPYSASILWTRLNSDDSDSKQASTNTDLTTVEFVAPPFEMSPPVFGIKHGDSKVNFDFNNVALDVSRIFVFGPHIQTQLFGGLSILDLDQTVTTTFSDYAGSPATPYSYPTPPDPMFSFELKNKSRYVGAGPNLGLAVQYETDSGFGLMGQILGLITAGTIKTGDQFTSTSARLTALGIGTSHQEISAPDATQVVFGADGKLGAFYHSRKRLFSRFTINAGYRMATFINAIATVNPNTLVQPGTVVVTPEFATGTMAIVSTDNRSRTFSFNGPFVDVKVDIV